MSYCLLRLDKSSEGFIQQLAAMLAVGAFEVVSSHDTLEDAYQAHNQRALADMKIRATGTPTQAHYEISDQNGKLDNWPGMQANREVVRGLLPPIQMSAAMSVDSLSGADLRKIRKSLNMSQTEFGGYLGGSPLRTVQSWELGDRKIPGTIVEILRLKGHQ